MKKIHSLSIIVVSIWVFSACNPTSDDTFNTELGNVFVSSNTQASVSVFDFSDLENVQRVDFVTSTNDAEGIYYDSGKDVLYQVDREHNRLNAFAGLSNNAPGSGMLPSAISVSNLTNGKGITSDGNIAVVADSGAQNRFYVYDISGRAISLRNAFMVDFPIWDVELSGSTLYVSESGSDSLAIFNTFLSNETNGTLSPDVKISIEGIETMRGLHYSVEDDVMLITDVADISADSADGGIHIIENFNAKVSVAVQEERAIPVSDQIRILGENTELQNPGDVAFDKMNNRIIVSERTNNGGLVLVFAYPQLEGNQISVNAFPLFSVQNPGSSGIFIDSEN